MQETDLYAPIKAYLEDQGYEVKGEVQGCDILAVRGDEGPLIVELKLRLNLELVLQGVERQKISDAVYLAVPDDRGESSRTLLRRSPKEVLRLVKLLGLGLIAVRLRARSTQVEVLADPAPYQPRKSPKKRRRLLAEFQRLRCDYNVGGAQRVRVTAYRQDAIACALFLRKIGAARPAQIRDATGVARAQKILYDNHYGWFERPESGQYQLGEKGVAGLEAFGDVVAQLEASAPKAEASGEVPSP